MKTLKFFDVFALLILWNVGTAFGQIEQVALRVDGLSCPFCAYGLEKKLKQIKGVEGVSINVDKGVATLKSKSEGSIEVEKLELAIKDAGFTPREISITAIGKIGQRDGSSVLLVDGMEMEFILKNNEQLEKLRAELKDPAKSIKVTGRLTRETPAGHHAHPYTLTIEIFSAR